MFRLHQHHRSDESGSAAVRRVSRSRWAAVGAAVAVSIGAGSIGVVGATIDSGERPVLVQIQPCRLLDTRNDIGNRDTPIGSAEVHTVEVHGMNGACDIPAEATGVSLNVTAVQASQVTNVRIFPDANNVPNASNLNPSPFGSFAAPNAVTTLLDGAGTFSVFNEAGTVEIIVDVNGYYEDHNHDDRYVQQNDVMWAVVRPDGTIGRSSDGVILSLRNPDGSYGVLFEREIADCAYQATVGRRGVDASPPIGFAQVANWDESPEFGVAVFTKDSTGATTETRGFHLLVTC